MRLSDKAEALRMELEIEDVDVIKELFMNQLSIEMQLLHHIIGRMLFSKIDRFDFISKRDLMVHVLQRPWYPMI